MKPRDNTGWVIELDCLVRHEGGHPRARKEKGWVREYVAHIGTDTFLRVENERTGGYHFWRPGDVVVVPPSRLQRAREKGLRNMKRDASQKLRRRRTSS